MILLPIECKKVRWSTRKCCGSGGKKKGNGFQKWVFQRGTKIQISKEIFKGMEEIKFGRQMRSDFLCKKWCGKRENAIGIELEIVTVQA